MNKCNVTLTLLSVTISRDLRVGIATTHASTIAR